MVGIPESAFRQGTLADAPALAELVNFAGEGMPLKIWETMRKEGETAWDVGRRLASRDHGWFSYSHAIVAEEDGRIAAVLIGYPLAAEPGPIDYGGLPTAFEPFPELERQAANTWYVNLLAVHPRFRRQGLGARLMALAEQEAARHAKPGLSVIVADDNLGAKHLYLGFGFRQTASRPQVQGDWGSKGSSWILLTKML